MTGKAATERSSSPAVKSPWWKLETDGGSPMPEVHAEQVADAQHVGQFVGRCAEFGPDLVHWLVPGQRTVVDERGDEQRTHRLGGGGDEEVRVRRDRGAAGLVADAEAATVGMPLRSTRATAAPTILKIRIASSTAPSNADQSAVGVAVCERARALDCPRQGTLRAATEGAATAAALSKVRRSSRAVNGVGMVCLSLDDG